MEKALQKKKIQKCLTLFFLSTLPSSNTTHNELSQILTNHNYKSIKMPKQFLAFPPNTMFMQFEYALLLANTFHVYKFNVGR